MYRVVIDRQLCSGFGSCAETAPHIFELDGEGLASIRVGETDDPAVLEACSSCPMGAIAVYELETGRQAA
jgi:ferredoxin